MRKFGSFLALSLAMTLGFSTAAMAAGWQTGTERTNDWKYLTDNGSYLAGWHAIDSDGDGIGEYYHFDQAGWLDVNKTTDDGYEVNADGQWVENGEVQKVDMSSYTEQENDISSMPEGPYTLGYLVYNYGQYVGKTDSSSTSSVSIASIDSDAITLYHTVDYSDGTSFMYEQEFTKTASGEYVYMNGDSKYYLNWDAASGNITIDTEERYSVYDYKKSAS